MQVLDRTQAPKVYNATEFDFVLQNISTHKGSNGVPVYYINSGSQEVVSVEWIFESGAYYTTHFSVGQAVAALLKSGTINKTALQIDEAIEFYGAQLKIGSGNDWFSVQLTCMSKHLPNLLPLVYEVFTEANFPQHELDLHNSNYLQRLKVNLTKGDFVANRKIDEFLFGYNHPYGYYNTEETIKQVQRKHLLEFKNQYINSKRCSIYVAGKFTEQHLSVLCDLFTTKPWNDATDVATPKHQITSEPQKHHRIVNDAAAVQGSIRLATHTIKKSHPDFASLIFTNTLFGGYFGSRLMSNIREDKGYTYGIYSYIYNNKYDSALAITTEAGKDVCEAAIAEVFSEMKLMREQLVDDDELQLVKNYILGGLLGDLDGPFNIIQRWKNLIMNGFTVERFYTNIETYKNITAQQVQQIAQQYLREEDFYNLIVY